LIDCGTEDIEAAVTFWSNALGRPVVPPPATASADDVAKYRELKVEDSEPMLFVQKVDHPSRIHLDIESDDMEAEVKRLEALGAKRVEFIKRWWVMEAPTGQRFCVVNPQRGPLAGRADANEWPDPASPSK
jgi:hypothetical protein